MVTKKKNTEHHAILFKTTQTQQTSKLWGPGFKTRMYNKYFFSFFSSGTKHAKYRWSVLFVHEVRCKEWKNFGGIHGSDPRLCDRCFVVTVPRIQHLISALAQSFFRTIPEKKRKKNITVTKRIKSYHKGPTGVSAAHVNWVKFYMIQNDFTSEYKDAKFHEYNVEMSLLKMCMYLINTRRINRYFIQLYISGLWDYALVQIKSRLMN